MTPIQKKKKLLEKREKLKTRISTNGVSASPTLAGVKKSPIAAVLAADPVGVPALPDEMPVVETPQPLKDIPGVDLAVNLEDQYAVYAPITGPLGNKDYIQHGTPAHLLLMGLYPQNPEQSFLELSGATKDQVTAFIQSRLRMHAAGPPRIPKNCPARWDPDRDVAVTPEGTVVSVEL